MEAEDNTIVTASEEDQAKFEEVSKMVQEKVLNELDEAGIDARAAHQMVQEEMNAAGSSN